jgi:hypothetical protein
VRWQAPAAFARIRTIRRSHGISEHHSHCYHDLRRWNAYGITNIDTSAQAAEASRPIAGDFAYLIFVLGIIGTGYRCLQLGDLRNRRGMAGTCRPYGWHWGHSFL